MMPKLAKSNEELAITLEQVRKDKAVADEKEAVVNVEKEIVEKKVAEAKIIKDEVDADFALALPILENAKRIVDSIDKTDIQELKALNNPPEAVVMVMGCVGTMLGFKKIEWADIRQEISDPSQFVKRVLNFDVTTMSEGLLKKVRDKWFKMPAFNAKIVATKSKPAGSLCEWALALSEYQIINKNILPKKEKAAEMDKILKENLTIFNKKMAELKEVKDKVQALVDNANRLTKQKEELEFRMARDNARMGRAEQLVVLLADEAIRWKETVETLDKDLYDLVGNVFLSCACISYFGAFTGVYRLKLTDYWTTLSREKKIPCSEIFSLVKVMGDPVVIRGWCIDGLPTDQTSCENGILTTKAERWGLCIDPQQ